MNELEQLHHRISELEKSETKHKQTEEKLKATNQQLIASEQQLRASNQQLEASEQQLKAANQQLIASEQEIKKHVHNLGERVKELQCLYGVSESIQKRITLEEIFCDVVKLIPPGWHYPEITIGKVRFDGKEYFSQAFKESKWRQSADIIVNDKVRGSIEVYYLEERPKLDEGPFMKEERNLIDGMAKTISEAIERKKAEEEQKAANQQLEASNQQLRASEQQLITGEKAIRKEKEFSEKIIETSNAVIVGLDKDHLIRIFNKGAEKSTGYSKTEVIGRDWFQIFFPPELLDDMNKVWNDAWGTKTHSYINPVRTKIGNERIISWQTTGMYEEKDITKHLLISIGEDITERKLAEEAMHQYAHIVSSSTDMLALLDKGFHYLAANNAYFEAFNLTSEELIGNTVVNVFGEEFFNTVIKPNADRCMRGEEANFQDWFDFPAYKRRYMDITYYPYYGKDYKIVGFVVNGRNITEHKLAEEKLKSRHRELQTFYDAAVGRELKVIELKKEINEMLEKSGEKPKYDTPV